MTDLFPTIITERRRVANAFPVADPSPYRIAIVGVAPGEQEENYGQPFIGSSGGILNDSLSSAGIDRLRCFVGNVCQVRPPGNHIEAFHWDGQEIQSGLCQLKADLADFNPHICVLLGATPLKASGKLGKISSWRGSLFRSLAESSPFYGRKCIASLNPTSVASEYSGKPLLDFDLRRARMEGETGELHLPHRELLTGLSAYELCYRMDNWPAGKRCSIDIEGGLPDWSVNDGVRKDSKKRRHIGWRCVALSSVPTLAYTIAWWKFNEYEHCQLLRSFARLMGRTDVPKVLQNGLYDAFVLGFGYRIAVRNIAEDTMIKSWEIYAELPRSLSVQASVWTREPHWKDDEMYETTGESLAVGCCKDTAVTLEICEAQDAALEGSSIQHYRTMIEIEQVFLYMQLRGVKYDQESVKQNLKETEEKLAACRKRLAEVVGYDLCGEVSLSPKKLSRCLYEERNYPPQYTKIKGRRSDVLTTDVEALLRLRRHRKADTFLDDILLHRHLEGVRETLSIVPDADGRVRCRYQLEAETGRVKCYTSPTGSGANMQTIQKFLRGNYVADDNFDFCQCDLEGADGWTVAAYCAMLGDKTMLEDYLAGLKPAKLIGLLYWFGQEINGFPRDDLRWLCSAPFKEIDKLCGGALYDCCKQVYHGSDYLMGIPTMIQNLLKMSFKRSGNPIYMEHGEAKTLQGCMFSRYPGVRTWHGWAEAKLKADGELVSASGHRRLFFGRRFGNYIHDTVKEFLAHEPQNNTTWATNLAALRLWTDSANRVGGLVLREAYDTWIATLTGSRGGLYIEPLHQVHDALNVQWPVWRRDWARGKMREYFNNELNIAGTKLTIPFDGAYGRSWGECKEKV